MLHGNVKIRPPNIQKKQEMGLWESQNSPLLTKQKSELLYNYINAVKIIGDAES